MFGLRHFLWGALTMSSLVAAVFFGHFWRLSRDRLFIYFMVAFLAMSLNWLGLAIVDPHVETRHQLYLLRLFAFAVIIAGVIDKNRRGDG